MLPQQRPQSRNPNLCASSQPDKISIKEGDCPFWLGWRRCARLFSALAENGRERRSVELRALCNEVPRTPPGPEGSNGTGITSGAADPPKFLSLKQVSMPSHQFQWKKF